MSLKTMISGLNLKARMPLLLTLIVGLLLGVAGQKYLYPALFPNAQAENTHQQKVIGPLVDIGEFTVNLQGGTFLKTTLTVEGTDEKAETTIKSRLPFIQDRVNTVLSNKSVADVQNAAAREKLRHELTNSLNEVADHKISDVLFLTLVYQ